MRKLFIGFGLMFFVVFPVAVLVTSLIAYLHPEETWDFAHVLDFVATQFVLGPSLLAIALILMHGRATKWLLRREVVGRLPANVFAGVALGAILGGLWSLAIPWTLGVIALGALCGLIYGILFGWVERAGHREAPSHHA